VLNAPYIMLMISSSVTGQNLFTQ